MREHLPLTLLPPKPNILPNMYKTRRTSAFHLSTFFISKVKGSIWWWLSSGNAVVSEVCNLSTKAITSVSETVVDVHLAALWRCRYPPLFSFPLVNDMIVAGTIYIIYRYRGTGQRELLYPYLLGPRWPLTKQYNVLVGYTKYCICCFTVDQIVTHWFSTMLFSLRYSFR